MPLRIEDYALLADGQSAALAGIDGSIDWLCWPSFESSPCFAALIGGPENGYWRIAPDDPLIAMRRRYLGASLVLETTLQTSTGTFELVDWMEWAATPARVVRQIRCVACAAGRARINSDLAVRFNYGHALPWHRRLDDRVAAVSGPWALWFDMTGPPSMSSVSAAHIRSSIELSVGELAQFTLTCCRSHEPPPARVDATQSLDATLRFWRQWSDQHRGRGPDADAVLRSLVTLKGLSNRLTGGIVAAPTTSLPEHIGGHRNWDYRYCWLRDASFTMLALACAGFEHEAQAWRDWLVRAIAGHPSQTQIMYTADGARHIAEWECTPLRGYENSRPVRFGNAAVGQAQHDIYGEIMNALYVARQQGMPPDDDAWVLERGLIDHVEAIWRQPDNGLWEFRDERRHFTLSKVMMWVAVDRAIRSARECDRCAPVGRWKRLAAAIRDDVLAHGFNAHANAFTQSYGSERLDASLLLLPLFGFLPADDPRIEATVRAIERNLMTDGLVLRYRTDGLASAAGPASGEPGEGAFLACSLWLAQVRHRQGRRDEAREIFERVLALRNDVGLLAEEYDTCRKRLCGNFPQTLSHVALINAARELAGS
ncbi:glycoside hydrolase family 15 protein [Paraburkholderia rhizosphaerae]|uniref:GH15 family glucan-1,4-alpha-glucosidase n=1 Tax=Paraburkholderia rhizosphaerae TaxID=480658 RepID=A0A4R8LAQ3_9BURK|nr:glycoside hydrolase family 15 protein [Paraburkholderia rhizosphaerae]TDY39050.1 GH15 family glucan-1,4-alpha-glucosidase [Paraburkholderia rhizosphaerae]